MSQSHGFSQAANHKVHLVAKPFRFDRGEGCCLGSCNFRGLFHKCREFSFSSSIPDSDRMSSEIPTLRLKAGRDKSASQRHPWVFSGALIETPATLLSGQTVLVESQDRRFLGWAAWSPKSQIRLRFWSFSESDQIDSDFFRKRLLQARKRREQWNLNSNALRLVHGEADGLPGLIVDQYARHLVVQFLSAGTEAWRAEILKHLQELTDAEGIVERSDVEIRRLEGLPLQAGLLSGTLPEEVWIEEENQRFLVNLEKGQKTGFYLDQRRNRQRIRQLAQGKNVLNCFCYSGGFSFQAIAGGATHVVSIDSSQEALGWAQANQQANEVPAEQMEWVAGDVFQSLRKLRDQGKRFDLIILDPPKFAPTHQHVAKASRAYKDINLLALKLLEPGGYLATFSCSGAVSAELFRKILAGSAQDARLDVEVVETFQSDRDHPSLLTFPEGDYLKGLLLQRRAGL